MSRRHRPVVLAFVLLLLAPATVAAPAAAAPPPAAVGPAGSLDAPDAAARTDSSEGDSLAASTADRPVINHTHVLDRTPDVENSIRVRGSVEMPSNLLEFTLTLPSGVTVRQTDGFQRVGTNQYRWDREEASTTRPTIVYTLATNRSDGFGLVGVETDSYAFVDADGIRGSVRWSYSTSRPAPRYEVSVTTSGEGVATDDFAYMGPHTTESYAGSQSFVYVRADAAAPVIPASDLMRRLDAVGGALDVGERDDRVVLFAPPADLRLGGLAGDASLWVNVDGSLDASDWEAWELWFHEYVHTRQNISARSGQSAYWLVEASADYYGGYFAWQEGHMTDEEFRTYLATDEHADTRLVDALRGGDDREYTKGRRVIGALDLRIRQETGGERTFTDVLRRVNARDVTTYSEFRSIVRDVANDADGSLGDWLDRHVTTTAAPAIPPDVAAAYDVDDGSDGSDGGDGDPSSGPPPVAGRSTAPTDPDGDGLYEDVNGDGDATPGDATVLFNAVFDGDPAVTDHVASFDFSGDGSLTPGDATVLFEDVFG